MPKRTEIVMDEYIGVFGKKRANYTSTVSGNDKCKC